MTVPTSISKLSVLTLTLTVLMGTNLVFAEPPATPDMPTRDVVAQQETDVQQRDINILNIIIIVPDSAVRFLRIYDEIMQRLKLPLRIELIL